MFLISKDFEFEAAHQLTRVPEDHKCRRLHGHSYQATLVLAGDELNHQGFIRDYRDLDEVKQWIDAVLDHRFLNNALFHCEPKQGYTYRHLISGPNGNRGEIVQSSLPGLPSPVFFIETSAENIAHYIFDHWIEFLPDLVEVRVRETKKTEACYRPKTH